MPDKRSRTPIRKGKIYCSPACGFKCTWAAFEEATQKAGELVAELGADWAPRVWENWTWHYMARSNDGRCSVSPPRGPSQNYTAYLNTDPRSGGRWVARGKTPQEAVASARAMAFEELKEIADMLGVEVSDENTRTP